MKYFKDDPFQPDKLKFPVTAGRKFRSEWYKTDTWLEYSPLNDKAYCFTNQEWQQKLKMLLQLQDFANVQENRLYLQAVCKSLIFCGMQSVALRGHDETAASKNEGNFLELMELHAKDSTSIKQFFSDQQKIFQYTDGKFQNELRSIMEEQIKTKIADEITEAKIFALIADEIQDIVRLQQVAVVIRHVNDNLEVHKSFIGFYHTEKSDGESLANLLDGASNMQRPYKGVASRIQKENPPSMYIHCNAHILNLCIASCCTELKLIRNTFFTLQTLYNFIEANFENIRKSSRVFSGGTRTLKFLSDTRWPCRVEAVRSLLDNFEITLTTLSETGEIDYTCGGEAILSQCDNLSNALQSGHVSYETVKCVANSTIDVLISFRTDAFFTQLLNQSTEVAEDYGFQPAQLPRKGRIPQKIDGGSKTPFETVEQFYKATILFPLLDVIVHEI
ncbi:hypothetical protein PR048_002044 [Dryococelus australis]|uniref:DUF4371 domain-containing protein n=1 Tax=Dryococelus australis TaxID=614101 RepID=A0ABQ9IJ91_9NEOP|nr:hypothetical protein PR048_002044 [Dryococelus australis]